MAESRSYRPQDTCSEKSWGSEMSLLQSRERNSSSTSVQKGLGWFRNNTLFKYMTNSSVEKPSKTKILDPQGQFLQRWNKIFVITCVIAVSVDPFFFYIPVIKDGNNCLYLHKKIKITASILRSFVDSFYLLRILFQFRTGFIAPSSRIFGRGVLVEDLFAIAKRYLSSYFIIDILSVLPLPQMMILIIMPKLEGIELLNATHALMRIVVLQYIPRLLRIRPLYLEFTRSAGIITETAWAGAAFNLFLYMLASHVLGASWYLLSIEREDACWRKACGRNNGCEIDSLVCRQRNTQSNNFLATDCPINSIQNPPPFDFGIYLPALNNVAQSEKFLEKFFYCFWWGLQNLSSLGQNLKTSTFIWENLFAIFVSTSGLVLFALLIGNMQTYLQSTTLRIEEMRLKRRDAEQWMSHRLLPENLRERIRRHEQYKWQETRGVDEECLIYNLPKDLRRDIKRHLCIALLKRVPMFEIMDDQLMDAMSARLKPVLFTENSCIVREGDPVNEMLFVMRGKLESTTTNGGRTGFFNSDILKAGDFCGDELLTWALDPNIHTSLPISTRTVKTLTDVEAFALLADDLKFVASQFRRLHSKKLQHTFKFHSQQWRTWAACFIQVAWRRYAKKKLEDALHEKEKLLQSVMVSDGAYSSSLGAALYASRFAANMLRGLRRNTSKARPMIFIPKPAEPDFSVEEH
ncbi:cyclic nucleotide-gated ion channel 1-like isoform X1 [Zingiber officinale]|uniref:cyclic nucleotide-gated ion channel 1-like isoform X1 n=2 Tax=Zingiber officinale TaxID=94328 RepID=UPI001C4CE2EA|nr:cyclic nucleotide-gated ion channel 1-like isoform X1 [Zingiber officinale]